MKTTIAGFVIALAAVAGAQEPAPAPKAPPVAPPVEAAKPEPAKPVVRHDPAALILYRAMTARIYRAHREGLAGLRCRMKLRTVEPGTGKVVGELGPLTFEWDAEKGSRLLDAKGKEMPALAGLLPVIQGDVVGHDPDALLASNTLRSGPEGTLLVGPPVADPADFRAATVLALDEKGRLASQLLDLGPGQPRYERTYVYRSRGELFLVQRMTTRVAGGAEEPVAVAEYSWRDQDGFTFPREVVTRTAQAIQTVSYDEFVPRRAEAKPEDGAAPAKDAPRPADPAPAPEDAPPREPAGGGGR
ncbi:MAG: hypothetical protein R3F20_18695 [Planctomycetota bacterium]